MGLRTDRENRWVAECGHGFFGGRRRMGGRSQMDRTEQRRSGEVGADGVVGWSELEQCLFELGFAHWKTAEPRGLIVRAGIQAKKFEPYPRERPNDGDIVPGDEPTYAPKRVCVDAAGSDRLRKTKAKYRCERAGHDEGCSNPTKEWAEGFRRCNTFE